MSDSLYTNADNADTTPASDAAPAATPPADATPPAPADEGGQPPAAPAADAAGEAGDNAGDSNDAPAGAPEKYEIKLPDGATIDPEFMTEFETAAKELNLDNASAQKMADLGAKLTAKIAEQQQVQHAEQVKAWGEASTADKEFGGDKLNENLGVAKQALEQFASPELREMLKTSGLGNHPEVIRAFYRVGKAMSSDSTLVRGSPVKGPPKSAAEILYGDKK